MTTDVHYDLAAGPLGAMLIVARGGMLAGIHFQGGRHLPDVDAGWQRAPSHPLLRTARAQLDDHFAGGWTGFDLPLAPMGTPFQRAVWNAIATVPYGTTMSYRELARRAGRPGSVRAAGTATGRNPWAIVVPCHRIVGSDGALTGYAGGLERKRALLDLEAQCGAMRTAAFAAGAADRTT